MTTHPYKSHTLLLVGPRQIFAPCGVASAPSLVGPGRVSIEFCVTYSCTQPASGDDDDDDDDMVPSRFSIPGTPYRLGKVLLLDDR
jgi:hypothetical protein